MPGFGLDSEIRRSIRFKRVVEDNFRKKNGFLAFENSNKQIFDQIQSTSCANDIVRLLFMIFPTNNSDVSKIFSICCGLGSKPKRCMTINAARHLGRIISSNSIDQEFIDSLMNPNGNNSIIYCFYGFICRFSHWNCSESVINAFSKQYIVENPPLDMKFLSVFFSIIRPEQFHQHITPPLYYMLQRKPSLALQIVPNIIRRIHFRLCQIPNKYDFISLVIDYCSSNEKEINEKAHKAIISIVEKYDYLIDKNIGVFIPQVFRLEFINEENILRSIHFISDPGTGYQFKYHLKSFLTYVMSEGRIIPEMNDIINNHFHNKEDLCYLYIMIRLPYIRKDLILKIAQQHSNSISRFIQYKLGKINDISKDFTDFISVKNVSSYSIFEVMMVLDLITLVPTQLYHDFFRIYFRLFRTAYKGSCLSTLKYLIEKDKVLVLNLLIEAISKENHSWFQYFRDIILHDVSSLKKQNKIICTRFGYSIDRDSNEVFEELINCDSFMTYNHLDVVLLNILKNSNIHDFISTQVTSNPYCYSPSVISVIFRRFVFKFDAPLVEFLFHKAVFYQDEMRYMQKIFKLIPKYRNCAYLLTNILTTKSLDYIPRDVLLQVHPRIPNEFDFVLLMPLYSRLFSENDSQSETLLNSISQFFSLSVNRSYLYDCIWQTNNNKAIAELLLYDQFETINESAILTRIIGSQDFAKCVYEIVKDKAQLYFENHFLSCLSLYKYYFPSIIPFSKYANDMLYINRECKLTINTYIAEYISEQNQSQFKEIIDFLIIESGFDRYLLFDVLSYISDYSGHSKSIYDLIINTDIKSVNIKSFLAIVSNSTYSEISIKLLEMVFDMIKSNSFCYEFIPNLICLFEKASKFDSFIISQFEKLILSPVSDSLAILVYQAFELLNKRNPNILKKKAKRLFSSQDFLYPGLYFSLFPYAKPEKQSSFFMFSSSELFSDHTYLELSVFNLLIFIDVYIEFLEVFLPRIIQLLNVSDSRIVNGAAKSICNATKRCNLSALSEIIPSLVDVSESRKEVHSDILLSLKNIFNRSYDLLLLHLDKVICKYYLNKVKVSGAENLFSTIYDIVLKHGANDLLQKIIIQIKERKDVIDVLKCIYSSKSLIGSSIISSQLFYILIQNHFNSSDLSQQMMAFEILLSLNMDSHMFDNSLNAFFSVINHNNRSQIIPYFDRFLYNLSEDQVLVVKKRFIEYAIQYIKQSGNNGFSLYFSSIFLRIKTPEAVNELVSLIKGETNPYIQDAFVSTIVRLFELSNGLFDEQFCNALEIVIACCSRAYITYSHILPSLFSVIPLPKIVDSLRVITKFLILDNTEFSLFLIKQISAILKKQSIENSQERFVLPDSLLVDIAILSHIYKKKEEEFQEFGAKGLFQLCSSKLSKSFSSYFKEYINIICLLQNNVLKGIKTVAISSFSLYMDTCGPGNIRPALIYWQESSPYFINDIAFFLKAFSSKLDYSILKNLIDSYPLLKINNEALVFLFNHIISHMSTVELLIPLYTNYRSQIYQFDDSILRTMYYKIRPDKFTNYFDSKFLGEYSNVNPLSAESLQVYEKVFISLLYEIANRNIVSFFSRMSDPFPDKIFFSVLVSLSKEKPLFFIEQSIGFDYSHIGNVMFVFSQNHSLFINELFSSILTSLDDPDLISQFLTKFSLFFEKRIDNNIKGTLNEDSILGITQFFESYISKKVQNQALFASSFSRFFSALLPFIPPPKSIIIANIVVKVVLNILLNCFPITDSSSVLILLSKYIGFTENKPLAISVFSMALNCAIIALERDEVICGSMVSISMSCASLGVPSQLLIGTLMKKLLQNNDKALCILKCIYAILLKSKDTYHTDYLIDTWRMLSKQCRDACKAIQIIRSNIGGVISSYIPQFADGIFNDIIMEPIDHDIICGFSFNLSRYIPSSVIHIFRGFYKESEIKICVLSSIPTIVRQITDYTFIMETYHYLIRGLTSCFLSIALTCCNIFTEFKDDLVKLQDQDILSILTGICFSYNESNEYVRPSIKSILYFVLGTPESKNQKQLTLRSLLDKSIGEGFPSEIRKEYGMK